MRTLVVLLALAAFCQGGSVRVGWGTMRGSRQVQPSATTTTTSTTTTTTTSAPPLQNIGDLDLEKIIQSLMAMQQQRPSATAPPQPTDTAPSAVRARAATSTTPGPYDEVFTEPIYIENNVFGG
jgi:hypothetical protein